MNQICRICNKENYLIQYKENVVLCKECKSIYTDLEHGNFPSITSVESTMKVKLQKKISKIVAESYFEYLKSNQVISIENMLDIGAGYGTFVEIMQKNGINAEGIESDEATVKNSNSNITNAFFDESFSYDKKFDLISINQCLYYFNNQFKILEKVSKMLKSNGKILISTINPESTFRLENEIWTQGCRVALGTKIFQNLEKFNLRCEDITTYDDNLYKDYFLHQHEQNSKQGLWKNTILYILKRKKMITIKEDGINYFVLLQKFD